MATRKYESRAFTKSARNLLNSSWASRVYWFFKVTGCCWHQEMIFYTGISMFSIWFWYLRSEKSAALQFIFPSFSHIFPAPWDTLGTMRTYKISDSNGSNRVQVAMVFFRRTSLDASGLDAFSAARSASKSPKIPTHPTQRDPVGNTPKSLGHGFWAIWATSHLANSAVDIVATCSENFQVENVECSMT